MKTTKLYQQNRYLKEWRTVITSVEPCEDNHAVRITLEETAFFPEGGGQSCDIGYINAFPVTDVQETDGEIYHTVSCKESVKTHNSAKIFPAVGMTVTCSIDWNRRFDNMQRHCGEHILSGVIYDMFGGVNRGFHMGHDYMTIDIALKEDAASVGFTREDIARAEFAANEIIWSDAPVTVMHFNSREEAADQPLRKELAFDEDITIVRIGSAEKPADCVACCGAHPTTAGQVGLIKIYKAEKYKGMFRIYFDAGKRAFNDYETKHDILTKIADEFSSSVDELPQKFTAQRKRASAIKDELLHLKRAFMEEERRRIDSLLEKTDADTLFFAVPHLSADDVFTMAKPYMGKVNTLLLLYSQRDTTCLLISDGSVNCGDIAGEIAPEFGGRGGGNAVSARVMFPDENSARNFAGKVTDKA